METICPEKKQLFQTCIFLHGQTQDGLKKCLKISSVVNKTNGKNYNIYQLRLMKTLMLQIKLSILIRSIYNITENIQPPLNASKTILNFKAYDIQVK